MKKLILLIYLLLQVNLSLADEERELMEHIEKYCSFSSKILEVNGKKCISHYYGDDGEDIRTKDMYDFVNKIKQSVINDDAEAFADLINYPVLVSNEDHDHKYIRSKKEFIQTYYKRFMNPYTQDLLSNITLLDVNFLAPRISNNLAIFLMMIGLDVNGFMKISRLTIFDKNDYEEVLDYRKKRLKYIEKYKSSDD